LCMVIIELLQMSRRDTLVGRCHLRVGALIEG
jgi:hypothetical protein